MLLKQHSVCLISGPPGIGKTTLAHMLLAEHITSGFEPIEVSRDINEAWTALDREAKQIFFYDDFLGQISFSERLSKNEDRRLSGLIEKFSGSATKKLILTTREYILRDAKRSYERLGELGSQYQFLLELTSYRKSDRANILYNHLWHSEVASPCLTIASHESGEFLEGIHDAYHGWLESTLRNDQDWSYYTRHLWEDDGVVLSSDTQLAARYENFAGELLQMYSAEELDLDGLQSMAIDFGLPHLSERIDSAMQEVREPDDEYDRTDSLLDDSRESDEYIADLFGRLNECSCRSRACSAFAAWVGCHVSPWWTA
ncbi:AAA family ATPase [Streptomyces sp. NPDC001315]|uniref:nSTAND3 domain-containing NTPase n=1 Tax=Streptomyces sp. NPDC001315 TaxID=3364562 RepID=UPI0036873DE9